MSQEFTQFAARVRNPWASFSSQHPVLVRVDPVRGAWIPGDVYRRAFKIVGCQGSFVPDVLTSDRHARSFFDRVLVVDHGRPIESLPLWLAASVGRSQKQQNER